MLVSFKVHIINNIQIGGAKRSWEGVVVGKDYFIASNALRNSFPVL